MGTITNYVDVVIARNSVGPTRQSFGTLLVLTQNATFTARTATYTDEASVAAAFTDSTSPERKVAAAVFAQNPAPKRIKFGRRANKSTLVYSLSVLVVRNSYTYGVYVSGTGIARQLVTFTSDSSATDGEIIIGLVAAINAVAANNYLAAGSASPGTVTADVAGGWFCLQPANPYDLTVKMTHVDPGLQADLTAIALEDPDFYQIYNFANSKLEATEIWTWAEANKRTFAYDSNDSDIINVAVGSGTDGFVAAKTAALTRTFPFYHHRLDQMPGAALAGRILPLTPGSETSADKNLALVDPSPLDGTHRANIVARNANGYETVAGVGVTFQGKVSSGEYLDVTRFLDSLVDDARTAMFTTKLSNDKVPMDDNGIRLLANDLRGAIRRGIAAGGLLPDYTMVVPLSKDISSADRASRTLTGLKAFVTLAGAIQTVNATITVA